MSLEIGSMRDSEAGLQAPAMRQDEAGLTEQWARVRARLQAEVGEVEYRTWLKQVALAGVAGEEVTVILPTRFLRDWVNKEYGELITTFWQAENQAIRRVEFRTGAAARAAAPSLAEPVMLVAARPPRPRPGRRAPRARRRSTRASPSRPSSSASRTNSPMPARAAWPSPRPAGLQPALPVWRRRPGQDASDARHRLGAVTHQRAPARHRRLYVGGKIHVPLHQRAALPIHLEFKNSCAASMC